MAKVSIAIPTYNRPEFLAEAIRSILVQTFQDFEIVIFDDLSDYNIADFLSQFPAKPIKFLRSEVRLGSNRKNFERISCYQFSSDYVLIFHDDDTMRRNFLEASVKLLDVNPEMAFTASSLTFVANSKLMGDINPIRKVNPIILPDAAAFSRTLLGGYDLCFDSVLYRTSVLENYDPYYERYGKWADRPYLLSLAKKGSVGIFKEKFINYRLHGSQDSQKSAELDFEHSTKQLYLSHKDALPQPLSPADQKLFLKFSTNNILLTYGKASENLKQYFGYVKSFKRQGFFSWSALSVKGLVYLLKSFFSLVFR